MKRTSENLERDNSQTSFGLELNPTLRRLCNESNLRSEIDLILKETYENSIEGKKERFTKI